MGPLARVKLDDPLDIADSETIDSLWRVVDTELDWLSDYIDEPRKIWGLVLELVVASVMMLCALERGEAAGLSAYLAIAIILILILILILISLIVLRMSRYQRHRDRLREVCAELADIGRQVGDDGLVARGYDPEIWWSEIDRAS